MGIQSGAKCSTFPVWDILTDSTRMDTFYAATNKAPSNCSACENLAKYTLSDEDRKNNMTWIASYLFDQERHPYYAYNLRYCPQFPDEASLASCSYCDAARNYFVHPNCLGLREQILESFLNSVCVQPDQS